MYLAKYLGNGYFETQSKDKTKITRKIQVMGLTTELIENNYYLACNVDNKMAVLPLILAGNIINQDLILQNSNAAISLDALGTISIKTGSTEITLNKNNDLTLTLPASKKLLLNGVEILTKNAVISSPSGPCLIINSGQA